MVRYLRQRPSGAYFAQVRIPADIIQAGESLYVEQYLGTSSKSEAKDKLDEVVGDIKASFNLRRAGKASDMAAIEHIAATWRRAAYDAMRNGRALPWVDARLHLESRGVAAEQLMDEEDSGVTGTLPATEIAMVEAQHEGARVATLNLEPPPAVAPWRPAIARDDPQRSLCLLDEYIATLEGHRAPKTIAERRRTIMRFLKSLHRFEDVTRDAVQQWHDSNKRLAPESKKRMRNDMRDYLRYCRSHGKACDPSVFDVAELHLVEESDERKMLRERPHFETAEIHQLIVEAKKRDNPALAQLIMLGMYTGCRFDEIAGLTGAAVNLKTQSIVTGSKTRAGIRREIPIHPAIKALMARLAKAAKGGPLFNDATKLGAEFSVMKFELGFGRDGRGDIPPIPGKDGTIKDFRSLRHGAAGRLRLAKPDIAEWKINVIFGWANRGMLAHYAKTNKLTLADKAAIMRRLRYR